jgi:hypothetical protein
MTLDLRSQCSLREIVVKKIILSWVDGRDAHYPTYEPNPTHVERLGSGKTYLSFSKPT